MGAVDFKSRNLVHMMEYKPSHWLGRLLLERQDELLLLKTALVPGDGALGLAKTSGSSAFVATWQRMCCFCSFPSSSILIIPPPPPPFLLWFISKRNEMLEFPGGYSDCSPSPSFRTASPGMLTRELLAGDQPIGPLVRGQQLLAHLVRMLSVTDRR